jgi:hypothetical protein
MAFEEVAPDAESAKAAADILVTKTTAIKKHVNLVLVFIGLLHPP